MAHESAVILPVPEVEPVVGALRLRHDRAARLGVHAHITLLYPFRAPQTLIDEIETLRDVCASIEAFRFALTEVRRFTATAYLQPDPSEAFAQITRTLVGMWPDCKPYSGAHANIIPHLTVADGVDIETLSAVEDSLRGRLPIQCVARQVWLMTSDDQGMWSRKALFPLAVAHSD
jgi:2'-5' RNA ligase